MRTRLWARVRDDGEGFDPAIVADPGTPAGRLRPNGRGIFLIRSVCDEVEWLRGGTEVYLVK